MTRLSTAQFHQPQTKDPLLDLLSQRRPPISDRDKGLSNLVFDRLMAGSKPLRSPNLLQLLEQITDRLTRPIDLNVEVYVVPNSNLVNAFALPDGKILVGLGILEILKTEDELAALLAHEIVHIARGHSFQRKKVVNNQRKKVVNNQEADIILTLGTFRQSELEADILATTSLLSVAGYNPLSLALVHEKVADFLALVPTRNKDLKLGLLTHGSLSDRAALLRGLSAIVHLPSSDQSLTPLPESVLQEIRDAVQEQNTTTENPDFDLKACGAPVDEEFVELNLDRSSLSPIQHLKSQLLEMRQLYLEFSDQFQEFKKSGLTFPSEIKKIFKENHHLEKLAALFVSFRKGLKLHLENSGVLISDHALTWLAGEICQNEFGMNILWNIEEVGLKFIEILGYHSKELVKLYRELQEDIAADDQSDPKFAGLLDLANPEIYRYLPYNYFPTKDIRLDRLLEWIFENGFVFLTDDFDGFRINAGQLLNFFSKWSFLRGSSNSAALDRPLWINALLHMDIILKLLKSEDASGKFDLNGLSEGYPETLLIFEILSLRKTMEGGSVEPDRLKHLAENISKLPTNQQFIFWGLLCDAAYSSYETKLFEKNTLILAPLLINFIKSSGSRLTEDFRKFLLLGSSPYAFTVLEGCLGFLCFLGFLSSLPQLENEFKPEELAQLKFKLIKDLVDLYPDDASSDLIENYSEKFPSFGRIFEYFGELDLTFLFPQKIELAESLLLGILEKRFENDLNQFCESSSRLFHLLEKVLVSQLSYLNQSLDASEKFAYLLSLRERYPFAISDVITAGSKAGCDPYALISETNQHLENLLPFIRSQEDYFAISTLVLDPIRKLRVLSHAQSKICDTGDFDTLLRLFKMGLIPMNSKAAFRLSEDLALRGAQLTELYQIYLEKALNNQSHVGAASILDWYLEVSEFDRFEFLLAILETKFSEERLIKFLTKLWWDRFGELFIESVFNLSYFDREEHFKEWAEESLVDLVSDIPTKFNLNLPIRVVADTLYTLPSLPKFILLRKLLMGPQGVFTSKDQSKKLIMHYVDKHLNIRDDQRQFLASLVDHIVENLTPEELFTYFGELIFDSALHLPPTSVDIGDLIDNLGLVEEALQVFWDLKDGDDYSSSNRDYSNITDGSADQDDKNIDNFKAQHESDVPREREFYGKYIRLRLLNLLSKQGESLGYHGRDDDHIVKRVALEGRLVDSIPAESSISYPQKFELCEVTHKFLCSIGVLGVRFAQLLIQFLEVPDELKPAFEGVYDDNPVQYPKMESARAVNMLVQDLILPDSYIGPPVGTGSLARVYPFKRRDTDDLLALKVLHPNARIRSQNQIGVVQRILRSLREDNKFNTTTMALLQDLIFQLGEWMDKDICDDKFTEEDAQFRSRWHGFEIEGVTLVIPKSFDLREISDCNITNRVQANRIVKAEEFIEGFNLTQVKLRPETNLVKASLSIEDYRRVIRLIVTHYIAQLLNGQVHSNPHPGNFRVLYERNRDGNLQVALLDRNMYLNFTEAEIRALLLKFSLGKLQEGLCDALLCAPENENLNYDREMLLAEMPPVTSFKTSEIRSTLSFLRGNGVNIPLRYYLVIIGLDALDKMAREAGFINGLVDAVDLNFLFVEMTRVLSQSTI